MSHWHTSLRRIRRSLICLAAAGVLAISVAVSVSIAAAHEDGLPLVTGVELQPFQSQAQRVATALESVGAPLTPTQKTALDRALHETDAKRGVQLIQELLDPLCLVAVRINPESRVKVAAGPATRQLVQHGWSVFLVKVYNEAGVTAPLACHSPNAEPLQRTSNGAAEPKPPIDPAQVVQRWADVSVYDQPPLASRLSGLEVEYRILEIYSRDAGKREAKLQFDVGQGTQDLGFRNEIDILFDCRPAVRVTLNVMDDDGRPTTACFEFRDSQGRVYPSRSRRLAPDFFFQNQVYRADGESILLPPGQYDVAYTRGPEYLVLKRSITVPAASEHLESFRLKRWIDVARQGWFSGDHHVHAAGCAHYDSPTQGVSPEDLMRHIVGEDLNVGCVLSWGPCWYYQKQFFEGKTNRLSTDRYLMRYDVEVSGFPSSHCGHLTLLRLKEDDYPHTTRIEEWPSWNLPILRWAKQQGAVTGYAHSGIGLWVQSQQLPNYEMPRFDGIGANDYIMTAPLGVCDFISTVDTPSIHELNIWYHTLNCGLSTRISGETDFPCVSGERVGLGRAYVKQPADKPLDFDRWVDGIRDGRSYVSDGHSHLLDFHVGKLGVGEPGAEGRPSVLKATPGERLEVAVRAAARLDETPQPGIKEQRLDHRPWWHLERARIGGTRNVPVELIVNGQPVARQEIVADGSVHELKFEVTVNRSSWLALRIFPSSHTNPVFVLVGDKPIRASQKSAQWCLDAVDVCWKSKQNNIRPNERTAAAAAYDLARQYYRKVLAESDQP